MAQLSNDCFAFGGALLRLNTALDDLMARLVPVADIETVPLRLAQGRILASSLGAPVPVPGFDNSAVDGYAVRHADLNAEGPTRLPVSGRIPAGALAVPAHVPGHATRIFTGAMMPAGADTVFMQEDVTLDGDGVILPPGLKRGSNARAAGEDFPVGASVLPVGVRLDARGIAALAALGIDAIPVRRPMRVAVFSTGDELRDVGDAALLPPGAIRDANRPMLLALLRNRGLVATDLGILPDSRAAIREALVAAARDHDVLLTSGGVSTGEEDHVRSAVEEAGRLDFWRLAIKPGRPVAMGHLGAAVVLGMPGNPAAVLVTFARFVGPVLDMLAGARPVRPLPRWLPAGFSYRKKAERLEYVRASLTGQQGAIEARRFPRDGAALISSLIETDGLVELEEERLAVQPGEPVAFYSYADLMV
ncbi:MAG: molybdopterin molybdotransferase MoeA [Beijerinckiaceae bacterium]|nr:molybdopterin molybdotransferase MoeA [Beijerinckiaceae bacterium]